MTVPRVCLGKQVDGSYGLRVSLPGVNVFAANPNNSDHLSFNSDWDDLLKIHAMGIAGVANYEAGIPSQILFPDLGYIPYCEIRQTDGVTVYDDNPQSNSFFTARPDYTAHSPVTTIRRGRLDVTAIQPPNSVIYIIFREAS